MSTGKPAKPFTPVQFRAWPPAFAAAQFRLGDPSPEGRGAIARRGGLEKRLSLPFRRF
jgi:hypothetical protein